MALDAWILVAATAAVLVPVSGAPRAVSPAPGSSAHLRVVAGSSAACPWKVSLLDAAGSDGGRQLCTREVGLSFGDSPNIAEFPASTSQPNLTTEVPLFVSTHPTTTVASDIRSKFKTGAPERWPAAVGAAPPPGYERVGAHGLYKLHEQARHWHEARATCEREGAHLLVLDSADEARALRRFLASKDIATAERPSFDLHAGFRLDLVTPKGDRVTYESWTSRGPNSKFCGQIDNDVWMEYGSCSDWQPFICEYELQAHTASVGSANLPAPQPTAECSEVKKQLIRDRGYVPLAGWNRTYVKELGQKNSWKEAEEACKVDGAELVTLESDEKVDALWSFIQSSNMPSNFYIGVKTGPPVTVLGEPLEDKNYQRWTSKNHEEACFTSRRLMYYSTNCINEETSGYYITYNTLNCICQINVN